MSTGSINPVVAAVLAALIMYGLDITGEEAVGVKDVVQP
jgi:hypothetical protein